MKEDLRRLIWMSGLALTLPAVLLGGPFAGYLISQWLIERWHLTSHLTLVLMLAGLAASITQTIRILRKLYLANKKD